MAHWADDRRLYDEQRKLDAAQADAAAATIARLKRELGSARHAATAATIGHEQLNRMIAIADGAGFKGVPVEDGMRAMAQEIVALRARVAKMEADINQFYWRLGARWFLEQNWFPSSTLADAPDRQ